MHINYSPYVPNNLFAHSKNLQFNLHNRFTQLILLILKLFCFGCVLFTSILHWQCKILFRNPLKLTENEKACICAFPAFLLFFIDIVWEMANSIQRMWMCVFSSQFYRWFCGTVWMWFFFGEKNLLFEYFSWGI